MTEGQREREGQKSILQNWLKLLKAQKFPLVLVSPRLTGYWYVA